MQAAVHPGSVPQLVLLPRRAIVIVVEAFLKDRIPPLRAPVVACMAALRQGLCWLVLDAQRGRHALTHTHITLHVTQASVCMQLTVGFCEASSETHSTSISPPIFRL